MTSSTDTPAQAQETGSLPAYKGSCHCGFISYRCSLNLKTANPSTGAVLSKCNCSHCHKTGMLLATPDEFTVDSPPDAEESLSKYSFHTGNVEHTFCPTCGVRCFMRGNFKKQDGTTMAFLRINVLTLDGRADGEPMDDLRDVEVSYWDGRSDDWSKGLSKKPYEGGIW
ncbi:hypothetical protein GQ53DRAFT_671864 [Thozetella sp. PMI_491]|nr:hypothetical protein GQ53DRAFT_671864 [Thozetella sp. PMI_491]